MASYFLTALKFHSKPLLISYYMPSLSFSQPPAFIVSRSRETTMALESGTKGEIKAIHTMTATRYLLGVFFEKIITRWSWRGEKSFVSHCFTCASNSVLKFWSKTKSQFWKECSSFVAGLRILSVIVWTTEKHTADGKEQSFSGESNSPCCLSKMAYFSFNRRRKVPTSIKLRLLVWPHCRKLPACFHITEGCLLVF